MQDATHNTRARAYEYYQADSADKHRFMKVATSISILVASQLLLLSTNVEGFSVKNRHSKSTLNYRTKPLKDAADVAAMDMPNNNGSPLKIENNKVEKVSLSSSSFK